MRRDLLERRRFFLKQRSLGSSLPDAVTVTAQNFSVSTRTVYRDHEKRQQWLPALLSIQNHETAAMDYLGRLEELYRLSVHEYLQGDNSSARIGALRLCRDLTADLLDLAITINLQERVTQLEKRFNEEAN